MNLLKLGVCIAWAGAAISSAKPAEAVLVTSATGGYANCSTASGYTSSFQCQGATFNYTQQITLVSTSCSSGACSQFGQSYVDFVYTAGRKVVQAGGYMCSYGGYFYYLGTCAC
jgi:hypothetical protein